LGRREGFGFWVVGVIRAGGFEVMVGGFGVGEKGGRDLEGFLVVRVDGYLFLIFGSGII
jgi:hypothetical protein